jgi:hypothetical protein
MVKKCSFERSSFKGGSGAPAGRLRMKSVRDKDFLLFGVMKSKSNY